MSDAAIAGMRENVAREGRVFTDEAIVTVLSVQPAYLEASFATIDSRCGSRDAYLEKVGGVTPERRAKIVARLVA